MTTTTRGWERRFERRWPVFIADRDQMLDPATPARRIFLRHDAAIFGGAVARGSAVRDELAPLAPTIERAIEEIAQEADRGSLGFDTLGILDMYGVARSAGVELPSTTDARARDIVPAIVTSRADRADYHWHRAFVALALDVPASYRGAAGFALGETVPFRAGATFGVNVQGFLAHLVGAIERGGTLDACLPAWRDLLSNENELEAAELMHEGTLVWIAWTLQHRIARQPIATVADFLHESIYELAGATP
jgi:hypothetical protein